MAVYTYKNPFLKRFTDRTGLKQTSFLSMYAPQLVRRLLNNDNLLLPKASWLIGMPGSGKTTILRLFQIDMLIDIIRHKDIYPHIYDVLAESKIVEEDAIRKIGIYLHIDELYSETATVKMQGIENEKLFFTLFDIRVSKQVVKAIKEFYSFNAMRKEIKIYGVPHDRLSPLLFSEDKGFEEFENNVNELEISLSNLLTSFPGTPAPKDLELHNRISCLDMISVQQKNHQVAFILMIDDAHEMNPDQFKSFKLGIERRNTFPRWIASRKHIYPINELLSFSNGTTDGRETESIDLDSRLSEQPSVYKKFIKILVDRRLKFTTFLNEFTCEQIESMLSSEIEPSENLLSKLHKEIKIEVDRLRKDFIHSAFINCDLFQDDKIPILDKEIMLIKLHRALKKKQMLLFPTIIKDDSDSVAAKDRQAAELFYRKRSKFPLYFGFEDIISVSSFNVEQFLRVFSPFIDRMIYRVELDKNRNIDAKEQSKIFKKIANEYVDKILSRLLYGRKICRLVDNLGRFFAFRTYEPNAPHAPGVTQLAILASEVEILKKTNLENTPWLNELSHVLSTSIANNVIIPEKPQKQGAKGSEIKHIFSLNRLLCIKHSLPMQRGGFQLFSLNALFDMCNEFFSPKALMIRRRQSTIDHQKVLWSSRNADI